MWFILEFLYNYVLILLFLEIWSLFLLVIYTLVAFLFVKRFPHYGVGVAACVSLLVTSSLLLELIGLYNGDFLEERSGSSHLPSIFFTPRGLGNQNWFGPLWKLNPVSVVAHLAGKVVIAIAEVCGRSVSAYVGGVFHETSWSNGIISLLFTLCVMVLGLFAATRYQVHIGLQGITLSRQWNPQNIIQPVPRMDPSSHSPLINQDRRLR